MNTIKKAVTGMTDAGAFKSFAFLLAAAFVFALPFMTKSLLPDYNELLGLFFGMFSWFGLSVLLLTVFGFEKTLKRVLYSLFCFFEMFYIFVYSWFVNLFPLDFVGLGNAESAGVIIIAMLLIPLIHSCIMAFSVFAGYLAARNTKNNICRAILVSMGYVAGEYLQSVGTLAFPWARLFVTQTDSPVLLQSASLFGSYFVTFIIVFVNAMLAFALFNAGHNKKKSRMYLLVAAAVFVLNAVFGLVRVGLTDYSQNNHIEALVLQGNIPSGEKWSGGIKTTSEIYTNLAESAADNYAKEGKTDIAVLPETAFPVTLYPTDGYDTDVEKTLHNISKTLDAELFTGAFSRDGLDSYNSIFVYSPDGSVSKPYNKQNIVPFGEFLPYRSLVEKIAPALASMNAFSSDISSGNDFMPIETKAGKAACLVCFDSIFSETARRQVKNGADFVVISTNDSWYKTSSAIYQHADHAVMRAIENNVAVIRSANTGISCIIDPVGRVKSYTNVNERCFIKEAVPLTEVRTLYNITGEFVVPVCIVSVAVFVLVGFFRHKKASRR